eukprot:2521389-Alexandrium_andersonii.AAC.1
MEALWRVLPPPTAFLPPHKGCPLGQGQAAGNLHSTGGAYQADCLICPVYGPDPGHWAVLVLERAGTAAAAAAAAAQTAATAEGSQTKGCARCMGHELQLLQLPHSPAT